MSKLILDDPVLDATDGPTRMLLAAEHWKREYVAAKERIAELEGLLRDIINDRTSPYDISDEMYGRIEAALGENT